jgi:SAM-dependent methyltransferase
VSEPTPVDDLPGWLARAGVAEGRGLEIGPLHSPRLTKAFFAVEYVDHASTEELRRKYADDEAMADRLDDIVDVDHVWNGDEPLVVVVGHDTTYDFVFASHVVEHAPDMIGWLREIAAVLADGGKLCLAIPDKRLCFDVNRNLTEMSDLVDAHLRGLKAPSFRQIYDFNSKIVAVDPGAMWAGTADYTGMWREDLDPDGWAMELCQKHEATGEYVDGHCQVFTPESFLDIYRRLVNLDLIEYRIAEFVPTIMNTIEFQVVLEKLPATLDVDERRRIQLGSIPSFIDTVPAFGAGIPAAEHLPADAVAMTVSHQEERLILLKRRAMETARKVANRLPAIAPRT